jgi:hypothetical protein
MSNILAKNPAKRHSSIIGLNLEHLSCSCIQRFNGSIGGLNESAYDKNIAQEKAPIVA